MEGGLLIRLEKVVAVSDASGVAAARRIATQFAEAVRVSETTVGRVALVATELATNLIKHANGGSLLCGSSRDGNRVCLISIDKGPGLVNLAAAMRDGFSTAGSAGTGLGAMSRSAEVDVYALPNRGTAVLCTIADDTPRPASPLNAPPRVRVSGICVPKTGEEQPGDDWTALAGRDQLTLCVADGLGHGLGAATASRAAIESFEQRPDDSLERLLQDAHGALRPTRGAAIGLARVHATAGRVDFAGVGNIAGAIADESNTRRVVSLNGIVGHEMRKVQSFAYPWTASSILILHSDGVSANWSTSNYPGLLQHDPALIAAVLYRDHARGHDDATVVVARAS